MAVNVDFQLPFKFHTEQAFDLFVETFRGKHPAAADCLEKDREALLTFYDFPAEHWIHLRTTNPVESTFATVRLRTPSRGKPPPRHTRLSTLARKFGDVF